MTPKEEDRIYNEMNAISAKLDILMPLVGELRGVKNHLGTLNGSVAKHAEGLNNHEKLFAALTERMANFFENAQEIKMMNLPRVVERVDWIYRFFWLILTACVGAFITALFALITK